MKHLYGFEHPDYYVHIKSETLFSAIEQFISMFGVVALDKVHSIHNFYSQSRDSKTIKNSYL